MSSSHGIWLISFYFMIYSLLITIIIRVYIIGEIAFNKECKSAETAVDDLRSNIKLAILLNHCSFIYERSNSNKVNYSQYGVGVE